MPEIRVELGARSYPVVMEDGALDSLGPRMRETLGDCAAAVVTDDHVAPLYLDRAMASLRAAGLRGTSLTLPHGERTKCLARLEETYAFLCASGITRRDAVVALGGGVIGDLAGLAAATFLRGVRYVQTPTTLLAQVDSSVGGKVAVDLPQGKNLVGAFHQPALVLADPQTLRTLPDKTWRDGLGEVVKYGAMGDEELFALLERLAAGGREGLMGGMGEILARCVCAKARVVQADELDTGARMTLNFGHTIGHALETVQHFDGLTHGEAVAAGMAAITRLSESRGLTRAGTAARLNALLERLGLPTRLPVRDEDALIAAMSMDKKLGDSLTVVLLDRIGACRLQRTDTSFFGAC